MRFWIVLLSALWLAGCGFQLRGAQNGETGLVMPVKAKSPLEERVQAKLTQLGIDGSYHGGDYMQIMYVDERRDRSLLGSDGSATEYLLTTTLTYKLVNPSADTPNVPKKLRLERTYRYNQDTLLASDTQEAQIRDVMLGELLNQLLMRYRAAEHRVEPRE